MKRALSLVLLMVVVIFTAQNYEIIEIRFLGWYFLMSRAVVIFLALLSGVLIGWLTPWGRHEEKARTSSPVEQKEV
ncbi:MAG: LapA family protein [Nitrososphaera sp.]|nr:LapA family protein [Nitrososphaera sp.]